MDKNIPFEELVKRLKKASKALLKENKNYKADDGLLKIIEAANIINK